MVAHLLLLSRKVGSHGMIAYLCNHHLWSREFKLTFIMVVYLVLLSTCRPRNHAHLRSRDFKLTIIMIEHFLLLSRYIGNHGHLWPRDFKQANECFYSSDPLLLTTARKIKGLHFNYFFIPKLKPRCIISKTVKIKGCEANKFLAQASEHESIKLQNTQNGCSYHRTHIAYLLLRSTKHQSIRSPKETQALTQITLHQFCKKQRVIALMD